MIAALLVSTILTLLSLYALERSHVSPDDVRGPLVEEFSLRTAIPMSLTFWLPFLLGAAVLYLALGIEYALAQLLFTAMIGITGPFMMCCNCKYYGRICCLGVGKIVPYIVEKKGEHFDSKQNVTSFFFLEGAYFPAFSLLFSWKISWFLFFTVVFLAILMLHIYETCRRCLNKPYCHQGILTHKLGL